MENTTKRTLCLSAFILLTLILWNFVPYGRLALYPFTILGTWFHEMAHGLTALILGADFNKLEINSDGSGVAFFSGNIILGAPGRALIAAAGLLGPTVAGAVFISVSRHPKSTRIVLNIFALMLVLSTLLWVRTWFGIMVIVLFAIVIFIISAKAGDSFKALTLQFLGVQSYLSLYLSLGYIFSPGGTVGGDTYHSDTAVIADNLFLPYWFWGGAIVLLSLIMIFFSMLTVLKGSNSRHGMTLSPKNQHLGT